jgi:hypothetical protein
MSVDGREHDDAGISPQRLGAKNRAAALGLSQSLPRPDAASEASAWP